MAIFYLFVKKSQRITRRRLRGIRGITAPSIRFSDESEYILTYYIPNNNRENAQTNPQEFVWVYYNGYLPLVFDVINKYGIYDRIIPRFVKLYEPKAARPPRVRIVIRIEVLFLRISYYLQTKAFSRGNPPMFVSSMIIIHKRSHHGENRSNASFVKRHFK